MWEDGAANLLAHLLPDLRDLAATLGRIFFRWVSGCLGASERFKLKTGAAPAFPKVFFVGSDDDARGPNGPAPATLGFEPQKKLVAWRAFIAFKRVMSAEKRLGTKISPVSCDVPRRRRGATLPRVGANFEIWFYSLFSV